MPASLEERAGRVLVVGLPDVTSTDDPLLAELQDVGVGGVLLTHTNVETNRQASDLVDALRAGASRGHIVVAADEEPGRVRTLESLVGSVRSARRLAAEETPGDVRELGRTPGRVLASLGASLDLAPVADLDGGPWDGTIGDRSFSDDPVDATTYALAYARGLQEEGVTPTIKHFPGHGRASGDDHVELPHVQATLDTLRLSDLVPFQQAIDAGAPVMMVGNVAYDAFDPATPASLTPAVYRQLRDMGFRGVAMTDSIGMGAVNLRWDYGQAAVKAIAAGADAVLGTDGWGARWMRDALVEAVRDGQVSQERLDEAATRMMTLAGGDSRPLTCSVTTLPALLPPAP